MASQLCTNSLTADVLNLFSETYANESIFDTIDDLAPSLGSQLVHCSVFGKWVNCGKILAPILTDDGNCVSFNGLNIHDFARNE